MRSPFRCAVLTVFAALALGACHRITTEDKEAAMATVRRNVEAMQTGSTDDVLATVHPQSPGFEKTRQIIAELTEKFRLKYALDSVRVELATPDAIHVRFEQRTEKVSGPEDFQDNKVTGVHLLKRDGKAWKIWSTEVRRVEPLTPAEPEE